MIYDFNGNVLETVCGADGLPLQKAYDKLGNEIYSASPVDPIDPIDPTKYQNYTITPVWTLAGVQGCDIYGDIIAVWSGSAYTLSLRNVNTGELIATLDPSYETHGNDISFMEEYYDSNDEFPLIYIGSRIFRITRESITLVKTLKLPTFVWGTYTYSMGYGSAFHGKYMYTSGYRTGAYQYAEQNRIRIAKLDMTNLTENEDGTYTPAIVSYKDMAWLPCIQGASYHDGMFWISSGIGSECHIYGLDPQTAEIMVDIPLYDSGELEGCAWGYNETDGWYVMTEYVSTSKYIKVTFDAP